MMSKRSTAPPQGDSTTRDGDIHYNCLKSQDHARRLSASLQGYTCFEFISLEIIAYLRTQPRKP